ncbi:hypothetical protein ABTM83_19395, partial [Acinetobacter baumannii]
MRKIAMILVGAGLAAGLAGCSGSEPVPTPTPTPTPAFEEQFGTGFSKAYKAPPESVPADVKDGDVVPVDP